MPSKDPANPMGGYYPAAPSPKSGEGSFGGHTAKEFQKAPSNYGPISVRQYAPDFVKGGGDVIQDSPLDQEPGITGRSSG